MRRELTADEVGDLIQNGPNADMKDIEVSGLVVIKDKDGNIKSELQIVSLETNQELENNAT